MEENCQEHEEHKPLLFPNIGPRKPSKTLMLFDGAIVDGDGGRESQYEPWPLVSGDEANNPPASKKPKLDLQLSLGLPSKDAESLQPGPSSHQSRISHPNGKPLTFPKYLFQM
ncbi:hypothetical protein PGTUg99_036133 [Puccinia graminis f. sp. tritici]|uniref:Uncharacterized protein n=1 Tax=Puccinia graminis f. sp. tritici TaxID=56615 RepID=A0A5B0SH69_PUCGR|nr:hypothetical protein PGTUg99_036133 [Puccinia graminis f. sp. tritici]